jgi:predicted Zn-dependent protease
MAAWAYILQLLGTAFCGISVLTAEEIPTVPDHFEQAQLADPLALPLIQRAVAQRLAAHDRAAAVKLFQDLAAARPDALEVQLLLADFLTEQAHGDTIAMQLATDALETSLKKHPGNPQVIRRLYAIYQSSAHSSQAMNLLDQLAPDDPESALLHAVLTRAASEAVTATEREKLDRYHLQALAAHPELATVARSVSDYFRESGRPDRAIEVLERHLSVTPSSLDLQTQLGVLLFTTKQDDKGEEMLKQVLESDPQQALAHQALAKFYRSHDKPALARSHAGELLKLRSGSVDEFLKLAEELLGADDPGSARLLLVRAAQDHPTRFEILQKLAIATRRDPATRDQASQLFLEAEAAKPEDVKLAPAFLFEFAEVLIAQGQSQAAEDRLRTAIRAYPPEAKKETAAALRRLALLWEAENRNPEAAKSLHQRADALDH